MASSSSSNRSKSSRSAGGSMPALDAPTLLPHGKHRGKPGMTLNRPFTLAGARNRAHLHLVSSTVSKCHAAIVHDNGRVYIRDLCSRTHVYVNGRIVHEMEVSDGDLIQIGSFTFKFQQPVAAADVASPPPGQLVESNNGGGVLPLDGRTTVIGRRVGCDLQIDDESVSTIHAVIFELDGLRYVRDLGSRTGTFINGIAAHQQPLNVNDRLRVGPREFIYRPADAGAGTFEDINELEDLVGTARLGHDELLGFTAPQGGRATVAEPGVPADEGISTGYDINAAASDNGHEPASAEMPAPGQPAGDDDLIPLASEDDWMPQEPAAQAAPQEAPPEPIDLDADAGVNSDAADTVAMAEAHAARMAPPTISPMAEDQSAGVPASAPIDNDFFTELTPTDEASAEPVAVPADLPEPLETADQAGGYETGAYETGAYETGENETGENETGEGDTVSADDVSGDDVSGDDVSGDDVSGGTLGMTAMADEPVAGPPTHEPPYAESTDYSELEDLGMSAHVIGVMPAQWARGPEATPLAVGPADAGVMQTPNAPVAPRFPQAPPAEAVAAEVEQTFGEENLPPLDEPEVQASQGGDEIPPQDTAAAETGVADVIDLQGNVSDGESVEVAAAEAGDAEAPEVRSADIDADLPDSGEIEAGDIDPSLTEAGLFDANTLQAGDLDIDVDELLADEPAMPAPADVEEESLPPSGFGGRQTSTLEPLPDTWATEAAEISAPQAASSDLGRMGTGLDFLEEGAGAKPDGESPDAHSPDPLPASPSTIETGAAEDLDGAQVAGPLQDIDDAAHPIAPPAPGAGSALATAGTAVVIAGAAAATAASAPAKRSIWSRLFARKPATDAAGPVDSTFAQPTPEQPSSGPAALPGATDVGSTAVAEDQFELDSSAADMALLPDDSLHDLGLDEEMSWPSKSGTAVIAGGMPSEIRPKESPGPADEVTALSAADAEEASSPAGDETAVANETSFTGEATPAGEMTPVADPAQPAGGAEPVQSPERSAAAEEAGAATPAEPARRLRPTIGVAEIALANVGGYGGQLVLSGMGPVEQLWGIGSGRPFPRSSKEQPDADGAVEAAPVHAAAPMPSDTLSATPMSDAGTAPSAVSTESLDFTEDTAVTDVHDAQPQGEPPSAAGLAGDDLPDSFFQELMETDAAPADDAESPADDVPPAAAAAPAPAALEPTPEPAPPRHGSFDPYSLMGRDQGSFFGGMPLPLGNLQPEPTRPARPRLPFADRPVTMDTRAEMLAEVSMVDSEAMPMFGASLPPGVRDDSRLTLMRSDLTPLSSDDSDIAFEPLRQRPPAAPAAPATRRQEVPRPAGGSLANAGGELPGAAGFAAGDAVGEKPSGGELQGQEVAGAESPSDGPGPNRAGDQPAGVAPDADPAEDAAYGATDLDQMISAATVSSPDAPPDFAQSTLGDAGAPAGDLLAGDLLAGDLVADESADVDQSFADLLDELELPADLQETAADDGAGEVRAGDLHDPAVMETYSPEEGEIARDDPDLLARDEQSPADQEMPLVEPPPAPSEAHDALEDVLAGLETNPAHADLPMTDQRPAVEPFAAESGLDWLPDTTDEANSDTGTAADLQDERSSAAEGVAPAAEGFAPVQESPASQAFASQTSDLTRPSDLARPPAETAGGTADLPTPRDSIDLDWHVSHGELVGDEGLDADPSEATFVGEHVPTDPASRLLASPEAGFSTAPSESASAGDWEEQSDATDGADSGAMAQMGSTAPAETAPPWTTAEPQFAEGDANLAADMESAAEEMPSAEWFDLPDAPVSELEASEPVGTGSAMEETAATEPPAAVKAVAAVHPGAVKPGGAKRTAIPRPIAAPASNTPLARKLEKPAGPRRVIAAKPASSGLTAGFRPPVVPGAQRQPGAVAPVAAPASPALPHHRSPPVAPANPPRDPFTNTGDLIQPAAHPGKPSKRRLMLILLAVVVTIGAIVAVWLVMKPGAKVQGRLQYRGLNHLSADVKRAFQSQQRQTLTEKGVLDDARREVLDAGMSLGILDDSREEALRLASALDEAAWDQHSDQLVIDYPGVTGDADRKRMLALLRAMKRRFEESPTAELRDEQTLAKNRNRIGQINVALSQNDQFRAEAEKQVNQGPERVVEAEALRKKADELKADFAALPQKIRALEKEVARLENLPSTAAGVATDDADPELKRLSEQLASLNQSLGAAMEAATTNAGAPKDVLDAAQMQFDSQVAAARDAAAGNIVLAGYLEKLSALQSELRRHNEELEQQQKDQREMLESLRSRLAQLTTSRIQRAWDANPDLKGKVTRRAVVERQYNVASASKLPEAPQLAAEMTELDKQIEALRSLIASKDEYDPDTKQVRTFIDDSVKLVEQSRKRNEKRLKDLFDAFIAAKPDMDKLPADQQQRAKALDDAYNALSSARAQYQAGLEETNVRADLAVRNLTQQVASQQAKVDARKRELAEARALAVGEEPPPNLAMDEPERLAAIQQKRTELIEARQSEAKLQNEWVQTTLAASRARGEADQAESARLSIAQLDAERSKLNDEKLRLNREIADAAGDPLAEVSIAEVVPESATLITGEDQRAWYSFLAAAGGLFLVLMALAASRSPGVYIPPISRDPAYDHYEPAGIAPVAMTADAFNMSGRRSA